MYFSVTELRDAMRYGRCCESCSSQRIRRAGYNDAKGLDLHLFTSSLFACVDVLYSLVNVLYSLFLTTKLVLFGLVLHV